MKAVDDVIFHMKKLLLNPFLHIKGGKYEGSRSMLMKEHRLGFPKIGRDLQIDLRRLSYGARKVDYFRHFQTKSGHRITDKLCTLAI